MAFARFRKKSQAEEDVLEYARSYKGFFATYEGYAEAIEKEFGRSYKPEQIRDAIKMLNRDDVVVVVTKGSGPNKEYQLIFKPIM